MCGFCVLVCWCAVSVVDCGLWGPIAVLSNPTYLSDYVCSMHAARKGLLVGSDSLQYSTCDLLKATCHAFSHALSIAGSSHGTLYIYIYILYFLLFVLEMKCRSRCDASAKQYM